MKFLKQAQIQFLTEGNYLRGQTPEQRYQEIVDRVEYYNQKFNYSSGLEDRIKDLLWENILSPSTPILANFGRHKSEDGRTQPLPVSCNIVGVENSIDGIYSANHEVAMLSKLGAGVGIDFTQVFDKGTKLDEGFYSNSKLDWIEALVDTSQKVSQNATRRGYSTPFISILDTEYDDLLDRVDKSNSDKNDPLLDNTIGIQIPVGFMEEMFEGNKDHQAKFARCLKLRKNTGKVYISYQANMAKNQSEVYNKLGQVCTQNNICQEISTPYYDDKTFACVISAINLVHWDKISSNHQIIADCFMFLDIVVQDYIDNSKGVKGLEKARRSAVEKRDVGLGALGFHDLLQRKGLSMGSLQTKALNVEIFRTMSEVCRKTSEDLAYRLGVPKLCQQAGVNLRNVSHMAVAPNKSTAFNCGVTTGGIEPFKSNAHTKRLAKIEYEFENPNLAVVLDKYGKNDRQTWDSIKQNLGSVQHLDFLTDNERDVFKTFSEISPKTIIDLASDRQKYIDMSQSLNLVCRPNYSMKDIYQIHKYAYEKEIKTLYYMYPASHAALDSNGEDWDVCESCAD